MPLTYEQCAALKKAGFPQLGDGKAIILDKPLPESDQTVTVMSWEMYCAHAPRYGEALYCPTLSELIEALGEDFVSLHRDGPTWYALGKVMSPADDGQGPTPEEACSALYLALHS